MKSHLPTLLLFFLILISFRVKAGHYVGSEMRVEYIDSLKYEISVTSYRDCGNVAQPFNLTYTCGSITVSDTLNTFSKGTTQNLPKQCDFGSCTDFGKTVFTTQVDLSNSDFQAIRGCSDLVRISVELGPAGNVANGINPMVLCFAEIDLKVAEGNSTPKFLIDPDRRLCISANQRLSLGVENDPDGDSISFSWIQPINKDEITLNYPTSGHSFDRPFTAYYPKNIGYRTVSPHSNPRVGTYLDPITGDIIFHNNGSVGVGQYALQVSEFRKDSSGSPKLVGKSFRHIIYENTVCPSDPPPTITLDNLTEICVGDELDLGITTSDLNRTKTNYQSTFDSVLLSWDKSIDGPELIITNSSTEQQSARFKWTPDSNTAPGEYEFRINATSISCPQKKFANRLVKVKVRNSITFDLSRENVLCNTADYLVNSNTTCLDGYPVYRYEVSADNGDTSQEKFNYSFSMLNGDMSLEVFEPDVYYVTLYVTSSDSSVNQTIIDTLDFSDLVTVSLSQKDTVVCLQDRIDLVPDVTNSNKILTAQWEIKIGDSTSIENGLTLWYEVSRPNDVAQITYQATTEAGCIEKDSVLITNVFKPDIDLEDREICFGESAAFTIDSSYSGIFWNNSIVSNSYFSNKSEEVKVQYADTYGCPYRDSASVTVRPVPQLLFTDTVYCGDEYLARLPIGEKALWNTGESSSSKRITQDGEYWAYRVNEYGCDRTDSFTVTLLEFPPLTLLQTIQTCESQYLFDLPIYDIYAWNTGDSTPLLTISGEGEYTLQVKNENGCSAIETVNIISPENLRVPIIRYQNDSIYSNQTGEHSWFRNGVLIVGSTERRIKPMINGTYTALTVNDLGCESDTSNVISYTASSLTLEEIRVTIYPNPTRDFIYLKNLKGLKIVDLRVLDSQGKVLKKVQHRGSDHIKLQWQSDSGIYFIQVTTSDGVYMSRVVKI